MVVGNQWISRPLNLDSNQVIISFQHMAGYLCCVVLDLDPTCSDNLTMTYTRLYLDYKYILICTLYYHVFCIPVYVFYLYSESHTFWFFFLAKA